VGIEGSFLLSKLATHLPLVRRL